MQIFIAVRVRENLGEFGEWTSVRVEYDYEVYFGGMIPEDTHDNKHRHKRESKRHKYK